MKAGDIKKFLEKMISSNGDANLNPHDFNIHDNFILGSVNSFNKGDSSKHIATLVDGFITTEKLTVQRRVAVLRMVRDILVGLRNKNITDEEKESLRSLLTAYFI